MICAINKYTHPLITRTVRVDGSPDFARALDFNAVGSGLNSVIRIASLYDKVRMSVKVLVLDK